MMTAKPDHHVLQPFGGGKHGNPQRFVMHQVVLTLVAVMMMLSFLLSSKRSDWIRLDGLNDKERKRERIDSRRDELRSQQHQQSERRSKSGKVRHAFFKVLDSESQLFALHNPFVLKRQKRVLPTKEQEGDGKANVVEQHRSQRIRQRRRDQTQDRAEFGKQHNLTVEHDEKQRVIDFLVETVANAIKHVAGARRRGLFVFAALELLERV
mmetsp:Transcript_14150/g.22086  ORF Transcript_14150/g.22086 Transcript_14150/m.22086 type:complete len:210 (+) Transcript_14150:200-829(+)